MKSLAYKVRLILAGVIVALALPSIGQVSAPPARDASLLSTGTLDDARLSSNVALYDGSMASFTTGDLPDARLSSNVALYDGNMASFTSGTLQDARLSANIPRFDQTAIFTRSFVGGAFGLSVESATPGISWVETDQSAGELYWAMWPSARCMQFATRSDDGTSPGSTFFQACRVGTGIATLDLDATAVRANGDEVLTGGWASVEFDGDVVGSGGAITAVSRATTGSYDVTVSGFTSTSSFACTASAVNDEFAMVQILSATSVQVNTRDDDGTFNDSNFMVICTGH